MQFPNAQEKENQQAQDNEESTAAEEEYSDYKDIQGQVAGNIHERRYDRFWNEELKPDLWTARVRAEGYKLSFKDERWPEAYKEDNNKSAKENSSFAWQQLMD